mgnify:CR=1 FL=1
MDIVHVLRDIESFDFYMNLRIQHEVVETVKKETRFTVYMDQQERYKNIHFQDIKEEIESSETRSYVQKDKLKRRKSIM